MSAPDLRLIMRLSERRGASSGKLWFAGERDGRRFVVLDRGRGEWALFERLHQPEPERAAPVAVVRPRARARGPAPTRRLTPTERREKQSEIRRAEVVLRGLGVDPASSIEDDRDLGI